MFVYSTIIVSTECGYGEVRIHGFINVEKEFRVLKSDSHAHVWIFLDAACDHRNSLAKILNVLFGASYRRLSESVIISTICSPKNIDIWQGRGTEVGYRTLAGFTLSVSIYIS